MPEGKSEADLVDEAVKHAVGLVKTGDSVLVAADCAADHRDLLHRREDIEARVREEVDDGE
jgi:molybdopterin synthase catalytic subunit